MGRWESYLLSFFSSSLAHDGKVVELCCAVLCCGISIIEWVNGELERVGLI